MLYLIYWGGGTIKERLKKLRKYFDMSQREFAERFGMSQSTYAPLENGREIRDAYVKLICQAYGVNEEWFRTGKGKMFVKEPDRDLEELLKIYDSLSVSLKSFLIKQAKELQNLQHEMEK